MIFVDSSVLIDYFNGKENWQVEKLDEILGKEIILIGDYVLVEVLQGFRNDKDYDTARNVLNTFFSLEKNVYMAGITNSVNTKGKKKPPKKKINN